MVQLGALSLGHFFTDMFGGSFTPLLPTLADRLGTDFAVISIIASVVGMVVNGIQPFAGAIVHRFRLPIFLLLGPLLAVGFLLVGEVRSPAQLLVLACLAAVGVGIFHPSALLGAHVASGSQDRVGIPAFLSGGAFGVAAGAVLATQWVAWQGYERLWWLAVPGVLLILVLYLSSGILRLNIHQPIPEHIQRANLRLPFGALLTLGGLLGITITLLMTFFPKHLETFLTKEQALVWGGAALGIISISGALSSYLWGVLSRRVSVLRLLAAGQLVAALILLLLIHTRSVTGVVCFSVLAGLFAGSAFFPNIATLARHAYGLTPGLRAGLMIGGSWSIGSMCVILCAGLLKWGVTVTQVLIFAVPLTGVTAVYALVLDRYHAKRMQSQAETIKEAYSHN
jgi:FSR family fosmidomycin resistance protein-like MFS transporter